MAAAGRLTSVDFEVFGRVQGVFFRKFTEDTARKLGLVGWVKNTYSGTVTGTVQGEESRIKQMKHWLAYEGSPYSSIDKCDFRNERPISTVEHRGFSTTY